MPDGSEVHAFTVKYSGDYDCGDYYCRGDHKGDYSISCSCGESVKGVVNTSWKATHERDVILKKLKLEFRDGN